MFEKTDEDKALIEEQIQAEVLEDIALEYANEIIPEETSYHPGEMQPEEYKCHVRPIDESDMA